jgi:hypothetical protein
MGHLLVALNEQLQWPIEAPLADEIGESLFKGRFRKAPSLVVEIDDFRNAARQAVSRRPNDAISSLLETLAPEEESTVLLLTWDR